MVCSHKLTHYKSKKYLPYNQIMKRFLQLSILIIVSMLPLAIFSQSLTFDQNLFVGSNAGMQTTYDNIYFQYGGNTQPWVIFWKGTQIVPPTTITLGTQTITGCTKQVLWAYYNPSRGNRLRPLDTQTLTVLETVDPSYLQLGLGTNKWFFTNCTGNPNAVYGHIQHTWSGTTFDLIAGATLDTNNNIYTNSFDTNLTLNTNTLQASGYIFDTLGWISLISTPPTCGNGVIQLGEMCDDAGTINGDGCNSSCQIEAWRSCTNQPSQCTQNQTPPPIINSWTWAFNAWIQFPSLYTNSVFINGIVYVTEPAGYIIQWATQWIFAATLSNTANVDVILSTGEWLKTLNTTFTSLLSGIVKTWIVQITLDLTNPTLAITSPSSGSTQSGSVQFTRNAQDANGIQNTIIEIYQWNNLIYSTTTQNNTININTLANGTYTAHITTYDNAGNSTTQIITFTINNSTTISNRSIVPFDDISGAELDTVYMSNPIIIAGLATGQTVTGTINTWWLLRNSIDVWTSAVFQNGDILRVRTRSATTYNTSRTVNLTINNSIVPFIVTTKINTDEWILNQNYCLNQNTYALIFLSIRQTYEDKTKFRQVLQLMLTMINTLITTQANQWGWQSIYSLQCFSDIVQNYLNNAETWTNPEEQVYTAPNGKKYIIRTTTNPPGYTSPDFKYMKIFDTYQNITKHIDVNNPGNGNSNTNNDHIVDPSFNPVVLTAPNGKKYTMKKTNKWFTSDQFSVRRYFETIAKAQAHINRHNPK